MLSLRTVGGRSLSKHRRGRAGSMAQPKKAILQLVSSTKKRKSFSHPLEKELAHDRWAPPEKAQLWWKKRASISSKTPLPGIRGRGGGKQELNTSSNWERHRTFVKKVA